MIQKDIELLLEFYSRYESVKQMASYSRHNEARRIISEHLKVLNAEFHKFITEQRKNLRQKPK